MGETKPVGEVVERVIQEIVPLPGSGTIGEDTIQRLAFAFCDERDYGAETRKKVLKHIHDWFTCGLVPGSQYREHLIANRGLSRQTVSCIVAFLRNFAEYCVEHRLLPYNPFRNVVVRGASRLSPRTAYTRDEAIRVMRAVYEENSYRDRAIVALMLGTALRSQAISSLNLGDLDLEHTPPRLWVRHKGHWEKDSFVYVYPTLKRILDAWLATRPYMRAEGAPMFITMTDPPRRLSMRSVRMIVVNVLKRAGLPGVPHQLRHTAITIARQAGTPLDAVKEMAGHRSVQTTESYDHSIQRDTFAPEAVLDKVLSDAEVKMESSRGSAPDTASV